MFQFWVISCPKMIHTIEHWCSLLHLTRIVLNKVKFGRTQLSNFTSHTNRNGTLATSNSNIKNKMYHRLVILIILINRLIWQRYFGVSYSVNSTVTGILILYDDRILTPARSLSPAEPRSAACWAPARSPERRSPSLRGPAAAASSGGSGRTDWPPEVPERNLYYWVFYATSYFYYTTIWKQILYYDEMTRLLTSHFACSKY